MGVSDGPDFSAADCMCAHIYVCLCLCVYHTHLQAWSVYRWLSLLFEDPGPHRLMASITPRNWS